MAETHASKALKKERKKLFFLEYNKSAIFFVSFLSFNFIFG